MSDSNKTALSNIYPEKENTPTSVREEKAFILEDLAKITSSKAMSSLRILFYPTTDTNPTSIPLNAVWLDPNLIQTEIGDVIVLFSPTISTFTTFLNKGKVKEILEYCKKIN